MQKPSSRRMHWMRLVLVLGLDGGRGKGFGDGFVWGDCWRKEFPFTVAFDLVVVGLCRVESERMTIYDSRCTCTCTYITGFHHPR